MKIIISVWNKGQWTSKEICGISNCRQFDNGKGLVEYKKGGATYRIENSRIAGVFQE